MSIIKLLEKKIWLELEEVVRLKVKLKIIYIMMVCYQKISSSESKFFEYDIGICVYYNNFFKVFIRMFKYVCIVCKLQ